MRLLPTLPERKGRQLKEANFPAPTSSAYSYFVFGLINGKFWGSWEYGIARPSLDLDLLPGSASSSMPNLPYQPNGFSDMDKSFMTDIIANAMEELHRLLQTNEPLWMKSSTDGRDVFNLETYERIFSRANSHLIILVAYLIGATASPNLGPRDVDDWQNSSLPENANPSDYERI
ncbi:hypothetical protein ACFX2I_009824 [Malus domestica]